MKMPEIPADATLRPNPGDAKLGSARGQRDKPADARHRSANEPTDPPSLDSETLLRGHGSVAICHRGAIYRLQTTKQGKLILTK